jgi:hypothetical protein
VQVKAKSGRSLPKIRGVSLPRFRPRSQGSAQLQTSAIQAFGAMSSRPGSAVKAIEHTTVFPGGAAGKTTRLNKLCRCNPEDLTHRCSCRVACGHSRRCHARLSGGERGVSDRYRYGCPEGRPRVCHDIGQPTAEVSALVDPAAAREAFGNHRELDCGRGNLGGRRVNLLLPPATSRTGGRASDANRAV